MTLSSVPREVTAVRPITRKPRRKTGPSRKVRREVIERARGCCERCGVWAPDGQIHHRLPRGMGGSRDPLINDDDIDPFSGSPYRMQCRCICQGDRCTDQATQEDGLCDWCGKRTPEQERAHPNAFFGPDGHFFGIGGAGLSHAAYSCWDSRTKRTLAGPITPDQGRTK